MTLTPKLAGTDSALVKYSARVGMPIMVQSILEKRKLMAQAKQMGLEMPEPITNKEAKEINECLNCWNVK